MIRTFLLILLCSFFLQNCKERIPECKNTNPVYIENTLDSKAYNNELVRELSTEKQITFGFNSLKNISGKAYILVDIKNPNMCVTGQFLVTDWHSLQTLKKNNGRGYKGAHLQGFKYSITYTKTETILNFKDLTRIID